MSGVSNKNSKKSTVECERTHNNGFININSSVIRRGMTNACVSYADAVRTLLHIEIVGRELNEDLISSEDQALSKPSEQSLSKFIKL